MHPLLEHGGYLRQASRLYGIPYSDWLDVSTGINPEGWPVPDIPAEAWTRLPEDDDDLIASAAAYYQTESLWPVAGSQAAIQVLPRLRPKGRVGVLHPGYQEHAHAWQQAGHEVRPFFADDIATFDVVVLIHPNNPTGERFAIHDLLAWREQLAARGGWLVVDEAFMDCTPEHSLAPHGPRPGLVVLRSLGKFFGLAGARVGFACAESTLLEPLRHQLGPWTVNGPARWVASQALRDHGWQQRNRERLNQQSTRLHALLRESGFSPSGGCALFQWVCTDHAPEIHHALACHGILTRLFRTPPSLRFGLPKTEADWERLRHALLQKLSGKIKAVARASRFEADFFKIRGE